MKTIVVIDISGKLYRSINKVYAPRGYNVVCCTTLLEGLAVPAHMISLLAIDPLVLGEETVPYIEALKQRNPDCRVLLCSGEDDSALIVDGLAAGADDFIVSPYQPGLLEEHIDRMLV